MLFGHLPLLSATPALPHPHAWALGDAVPPAAPRGRCWAGSSLGHPTRSRLSIHSSKRCVQPSRLPGLSEPRLLQAHSSSLFLLLAGSTATWVSPRSQRPAARAGEPCSSLFSWLHPEVRFTGGGLLGSAPGSTARYGRGATQAGWECPESPQPAVTSTLPLLLLLLRWDSPAGCSGVSILHQEHL